MSRRLRPSPTLHAFRTVLHRYITLLVVHDQHRITTIVIRHLLRFKSRLCTSSCILVLIALASNRHRAALRSSSTAIMAPLNQHIPTQLRQLIYYNLDNNQLHNATFIAARLHAYDPRSPEAAYLLAQCHLQSGQSKAALDYSRSAGSRGTHLGCSFVYAQACMDLGKYLEGVTALERAKIHWAGKSNWSESGRSKSMARKWMN